MRMGTKSLLYGAHCFFLHPWFVAAAWIRLYGFPNYLALWASFFVHDLGYFGKTMMDDAEGRTHPILGARIMRLFGPRWSQFTLLHSRFYSKYLGEQYSQLCVADKLAFVMTPRWLYLAMTRATGEIDEYISRSRFSVLMIGADPQQRNDLYLQWHAHLRREMLSWVAYHRFGDSGLCTCCER